MLIYSLDPGITSGYAIADVEWAYNEITQGPDFLINSVIESGEFKYSDTIKHLYKARPCDVIVIEDFVVRKSLIGDRLLTVRVIGAFEIFFASKVVFQQPAEKVRAPDAILKSNSLWSNSKHTRDALRHLLIYLYKQRGPRNKVLMAKVRTQYERRTNGRRTQRT